MQPLRAYAPLPHPVCSFKLIKEIDIEI
jgi:hypothetical protein